MSFPGFRSSAGEGRTENRNRQEGLLHVRSLRTSQVKRVFRSWDSSRALALLGAAADVRSSLQACKVQFIQAVVAAHTISKTEDLFTHLKAGPAAAGGSPGTVRMRCLPLRRRVMLLRGVHV